MLTNFTTVVYKRLRCQLYLQKRLENIRKERKRERNSKNKRRGEKYTFYK